MSNLKVSMYSLTDVPRWRWWIRLAAVTLQGRLERLGKAMNYMLKRLNRELYRKQLQNWALKRELAKLTLELERGVREYKDASQRDGQADPAGNQ
jgi:hypothetical protein